MLYFGRKFWAGLLLSAGVVIWTLSSAGENEDGLKTGLLVVVGGIIGILFAPLPKPVDHSTTANTSVERLLDMAQEITGVQNTVTALITEVEDPMVKIRLVAAQNALLQQEERMQRSVGDWDEIAPGVAVRVRTKLDAGRIRFLELMERDQIER